MHQRFQGNFIWVLFYIISLCYAQTNTNIAYGICNFVGTAFDPNIRGSATFTQNSNGTVLVSVNITGITNNLNITHGLHVHEFGDLSDTLLGNSAGAHYNPAGAQHGCPEVNGTSIHEGDLGNWFVDAFGNLVGSKVLNLLQLSGNASIIGRAVVLHNLTDTCTGASGNSGNRLAFCVIGIESVTGNLAINSVSTSTPAAATCQLQPTAGNSVTGTVSFYQPSPGSPTTITATIFNLGGPRGIHIHTFGDLSSPDGLNTGGHYNPTYGTHAIPPIATRHVGDLGNVYYFDLNGTAYYSYNNELVNLTGPNNVIGRGLIIHSIFDNCSGIFGNRIAQCVIGFAAVTNTSGTTLSYVPTAQNSTLCVTNTNNLTSSSTVFSSSSSASIASSSSASIAFSSASVPSTTAPYSTTGGPTYNPGNFSLPKFNYVLSQNKNYTYLTQRAGIACVEYTGETGYTLPNKYFRIFPLSQFGILSPFTVTAVAFGVEISNVGSITCQPIFLSLYYKYSSSTSFLESDLILITSTSVSIPNLSLSFVSIPIIGTVPLGATLVVSIETADGFPTGSSLFLGCNFAGENSPSYIEASACKFGQPTPMTDVGFNTDLVWLVTNDTHPTVTNFKAQCPCVPDSCSGYCGARPWCYSSSPCWCNNVCLPGTDQPCCGDITGLCNITYSRTSSPAVITNPNYGNPDQLNAGGIAAVTIVLIAVAAGTVAIIVLFLLYRKRNMFRRRKLQSLASELEDKERSTPMEEVSLG